MKPDITKFSWGEAFSSTNGKSSIPLVCGFLVILTGCLGFTTSGIVMLIMTSVVHTKDTSLLSSVGTLLTQAVIVIGIGTTLLGIRRFTSEKTITAVDKENE